MIDNQIAREVDRPRWIIETLYVCAFALGASIDIIRHSYDRIAPAVRSGALDDSIIQRAIVATFLTLLVVSGVYFGSRWSGRRLGIKHRTGLQAVFVLTPVIVYILEH